MNFVVKKKPSTLKAARLIDSAKFLFAPATAVTVMIVLKLPVSTSHAVIGHIVGVERMQKHVARTGIDKIFVCWVVVFFLFIVRERRDKADEIELSSASFRTTYSLPYCSHTCCSSDSFLFFTFRPEPGFFVVHPRIRILPPYFFRDNKIAFFLKF